MRKGSLFEGSSMSEDVRDAVLGRVKHAEDVLMILIHG